MNNLLKRLLELSARTGDRIVFADFDGDNAHVVLSLADYERLVLKNMSKYTEKGELEKPTKQNFAETLAAPVKVNPLDEMNQEIVRTLESERVDSETGNNFNSIQVEAEIEPEERYFLEPLE